ncbi:MAG: hypothetical protein HYT49_01225 [Candidatus Wildermuthbacteria bacterium]|nr:hypothetical protein [Candidatus Wildermuthbacteria bacterium]
MDEPRKQPASPLDGPIPPNSPHIEAGRGGTPPPNIPSEPVSSSIGRDEPASPISRPNPINESAQPLRIPPQPVQPPTPLNRGESLDRPPQPPVSPQAERAGGPPQQENNESPPSADRPVGRQQSQPFRPEQKRVYLERGEVRGMEKDIARVREEEAKLEQQRISALKTNKETEKEQEAIRKIRTAALTTRQQEEAQRKKEFENIRDSILPPGEEQRIRNLPSPPSSGKKVFIRLLVVIFFAFVALNVVFFASWFFFFRGPADSFQFPEIPFISQFLRQEPTPPPAPPTSTPTASPEPTLSTPTPEPEPSPQTPANQIQDAINPAHTATLQFTEGSDLAALLAQFLQTEQQPAFTQILFRQRESNELVTTSKTFFNLFGVTPPENVASHFSANTFFFLYSYERGNRFGMIMETSSPQEAQTALAQWENRMEQDLAPVMSFWDAKGPAYTTLWRTRARHGVDIRFQTFSLQDHGIVYALVDKYVIFASSFEATAAAIEALQTISPSTFESRTLAALQDSDLLNPSPPLSLEQALGQIFMIGFPDATLTRELEDTMRRLQPGGVLLLSKNIQSIEQLQQLVSDLQRLSLEYSSLPLFIAVDQEGGAISRIAFGKEKTAQSTIQDQKQAYEVGQLRAEELKSLGVNVNLSPVLDSTEPHDFLFARTFQSGRLEAGQLAKALLQGQKEGGILSTVKHFPGYGTIAFNPELKLAAVQDFPDISPFVFALPAEPEFLLLSNVIYASLDSERPFSFSPKGIGLIRSDLGFEGIILTDDLNQPSLLDNYSLETIAVSPLKAGVNMIMFSQDSYAKEAHKTLSRLVEQDSSLKKNIEDSATRILQLKKEFFFLPEPQTPFEHLTQK